MMECLRKCLKEKPLTKRNLIHHYLPAVGSLSYAGLGVSVIQPGFLRRICPARDLTNVCLTASIAGSFLYLYDRKHLSSLKAGDKFTYSLLTSTMFNLGSLLLWAMVRSGTADVNAPQFKFFIAAATAYWLTKLGIKYLDVIDSQIK